MSQQIQITGGAKVRNLEGVLTGTAGVVNSLGINVPDGIPKLDGSGKILVSQLPNSVMEFKGTWNAATNTPTLANGTGNAGDVYLCNVAGTVNFGSGPIIFAIGDQVLYSGTTWERASGATGTVTSVAVTESGDALTITGSPITTSGTINIGFAGTSGQYVNGAGGLTTFPSLTGFVPYTGATGNVNLGEFGLTSGFVGFDLTPTGTPTGVGTLSWDSAYRTLQLIDGDGDTTLQIGQEQRALVHNNTGAILTDGQVVYVTGSTGNLPTVALASNTLEASSSVTFGVVTESIANGADGFVTISGTVNGLNTLAFNEGDALYLGSTAGTFTNVKPVAPANLVLIGYMIKKAGGNGSIFVKIQNGYELEELHDVLVTSVANNQGLFWDSATSLWKNKSIATALGYTPADDSLVVKLAGTQTITGIKTFTSEIRVNTTDSTGGVLNLKRGTFIGPIPNYTSIFSEGDELSIASQGTTTLRYAKFDLSGLTSGTTRTYTLPDATGTLALTSDIPSLANYVTLNGIQSITGEKTFANNTLKLAATGTGGLVTFLSNISGTGLTSSGSNAFGFNSNNDIYFAGSDKVGGVFAFNNTAVRTYTLQNANGTLAFISDIPSLAGYVPYTGATTFVDLGANSATASYFQGNSGILLGQNSTISTSGAFTVIGGDADGISIRPSSSRVFLLTFPSTGRQYIFPNAAGTIALTSNLSAYVPTTRTLTINGTSYDLSSDRSWTISAGVTGSGTNNRLAKFTSTGSTIGDSIISADANTATITSTVVGAMFILDNPTASGYSQMQFKGDTKSAYIFKGNSNYTDWGGANALNFYTDSVSGGGFSFNPRASANAVFIDPLGNLGIGVGTTVSAKLDIAGGNAKLTHSINGGAIFNTINPSTGTSAYSGLLVGNDFVTSGGGFLMLGQNYPTTGPYTSNGAYAFGNQSGGLTIAAEAGTLKFVTGTTIKATMITNGNLGLNETAPTNLLHLAGNVATPSLRLASTSTGFYWDIGRENATTGDFVFNYKTPSTSSTEWVRITTLGLFGIGVTPSGTYGKLTVAGGIRTTADSLSKLEIGRYNAGNPDSYIKLGSTSNGLIISNAADSLDLFYLKNSGKFGIGISPTAVLDVQGSVGGALSYMRNNETVGYTGIDFFRQDGTHAGSVWCANDTAGATNNRNALTLAARQSGEKVIIVGGGYDPTVTGGLTIAGPVATLVGSSAHMTIEGSGNYAYIELKGTTTSVRTSYFIQNNTGVTANGVSAGAAYMYFDASQQMEFVWTGISRIQMTSGGQIYAQGFYEISDMRLKTLLEDNYIINSISDVKAKLYKKNGVTEVGYYAQDLKEILPSSVTEGSNGFLSLSYNQVHTAKIAYLEDKVHKLEELIKTLIK